jgi:hypothetical protein
MESLLPRLPNSDDEIAACWGVSNTTSNQASVLLHSAREENGTTFEMERMVVVVVRRESILAVSALKVGKKIAHNIGR